MLPKLDTSSKVFGVLMLVILGCLTILPLISSHQAKTTLDALTGISAKERSYHATREMLTDAETGQRGYLLGTDESFLEPYNASIANLPDALDGLARSTSSPNEREVVAKITKLTREKLVYMSQTISLKRAGESQEAADMVASQRGKLLMDQIRVLFKSQHHSLALQRTALREKLTSSLQYNTALGIGASLANLAIICTSIFVAANSLNQRAEAAKQAEMLAESNAEHAESESLRADRASATAQMLQAIDNIKAPAELSHVIPVFLSKILSGTSGGIYLYRNSRDFLELKAQWGEVHVDTGPLSPSDCWGLRFGKIHQTIIGKDLCCAHSHVHSLSQQDQMCIPMISQGDVIGLIVIVSQNSTNKAFEREAIVTLAEQLALAINNVMLREMLRQQSIVDPLTGLYNRRHFDESLKRELIRSKRADTSCSAVMMDLDHFKRINDTYGHDAGDLVLKAVSQNLLTRVRGSDLVCRYGGEELVLLLPDCTDEAAEKCAENIRQSIAEISIYHLGQHITGITASFGVASFPAHAQDTEGLLKAADLALYAAKNAGRNRVVVAGPWVDKLIT
jgi:diguanylate cyclase (GGDEF)-like protein